MRESDYSHMCYNFVCSITLQPVTDAHTSRISPSAVNGMACRRSTERVAIVHREVCISQNLEPRESAVVTKVAYSNETLRRSCRCQTRCIMACYSLPPPTPLHHRQEHLHEANRSLLIGEEAKMSQPPNVTFWEGGGGGGVGFL